MTSWAAVIAAGVVAALVTNFTRAQDGGAHVLSVADAPDPAQHSSHGPALTQQWLLNNPTPHVVPEGRANVAAVRDKFAARMESIEQRAVLRAYDGAPPTIPHPIADMNIQTCRACHAEGLTAGGKVARMASHTYLTNCTQCHVEAESPWLDDADATPGNTFVGPRPSGYGSTRAWAGAPPTMPHTTFMRTNCISCHGEHGHKGWQPDHLSRSNCVQCHAPAAELNQLAPTFNMPSIPDGLQSPPDRTSETP